MIRMSNTEKTRYFIETAGRSYGYFLAIDKVLYQGETPFQKIAVFSNKLFGNVLRLDNVFQTSEGDEFFFHETIALRPICAHPNPKKVLIIGGGDGGSAEEALKSSCVEKVVMIELDEEVVVQSKKFLPKIHKGAFDNPKLELRFEDGLKYIENTKEQFDVIVVDMTDPIGPSVNLYTQEFYKRIAYVLGPNGILSLHTESPFLTPDSFNIIQKTLTSVFKYVSVAFVHVPAYGATFSFSACSNGINVQDIAPDVIERRIKERGVKDLQFYNGEVHRGMHAMPNYVKDILKKPAKILTKADNTFPQDMIDYTDKRHPYLEL